MDVNQKNNRSPGLSDDGRTGTSDRINTGYDNWKKNPTSTNVKEVMTLMSHDLDRAIQSAGGKPDALSRGTAKGILFDAMKTFDPKAGTQFRSWAQQKLRGLVRPIRSSRFVLKVPEARAREAARVRSYIDSIQGESGFEPSDEMISDALAIPLNKVGQARTGISPEVIGDEVWHTPEAADNSALIRDMVYVGLAPRDQTIFEYAYGYNGVKVLPSTEIASKLKVSPAAISQRLSKIRDQVELAEDGL